VVREIQSNENQVIGSENNTDILTVKFRTPNNLYICVYLKADYNLTK